MIQKRAILEDREKKEKEKKKEVPSVDVDDERHVLLKNKVKEIIGKKIQENMMLKDMSLSTKTIHTDDKRIVVVGVKGKRELKMKTQVMQLLTEATLQRLGGSTKAILEMNKGLLHVLHLIDVAPEGKISTRKLLGSINSTSMHKYLKEAEELGFIQRYTERMPQGQKGGIMVMNALTEKGRCLLQLHDELDSNISSNSRCR
jgi:hypothetical protein